MKIQVPEKLSDRANDKFREIYILETGVSMNKEAANILGVFLMHYLAAILNYTDNSHYKNDGN